MNKYTKSDIITSANGINYYVICSKDAVSGRCYGIFAEMTDDKTDSNAAENLFFTRTEAEEYCKWLANNEVYPVTLCEVLGNIYHLQY